MTTSTNPGCSTLLESCFESPTGGMYVLSHDDSLCFLGFESPASAWGGVWFQRHFGTRKVLPAGNEHEQVHEQLERYFTGKLKKFRIKTQLFGTDFQLQVWTALRTIPYGITTTYSSIAELIGNPRASRAVGQAIGRNPLAVVIPCHRVIGEDASLVGYSGGIDRKKLLLQIEGVLLV